MNSSLAATVFLPLIGILAILLPRPTQEINTSLSVGPWRRIAAVNIDFVVIICCTAPFAFILLLLEWHATGEFVWSFHRTYSRGTDIISFIGLVLIFVLTFYYFYKQAKIQRATAGQFIMGYKIIPEIGAFSDPDYMVRTRGAAIAYCIWPIGFLEIRNRTEDVFSWDKKSYTQAVRVQ